MITSAVDIYINYFKEIIFSVFVTVLRVCQTAMSWTAIFMFGLFVFSNALANERE